MQEERGVVCILSLVKKNAVHLSQEKGVDLRFRLPTMYKELMYVIGNYSSRLYFI